MDHNVYVMQIIGVITDRKPIVQLALQPQNLFKDRSSFSHVSVMPIIMETLQLEDVLHVLPVWYRLLDRYPSHNVCVLKVSTIPMYCSIQATVLVVLLATLVQATTKK